MSPVAVPPHNGNLVVVDMLTIGSCLLRCCRHFTTSVEGIKSGRAWTTVTANFSHFGALHLLSNMYLLNHFSTDVIGRLNKERYLTLYFSSGVAAMLTSLTFRRITRSNAVSLGASGCVMGVMFMYANLFPEREVHFFGWSMTAQEALVMWALIDAAGLLGSFGRIDFAAHLGGAGLSAAYHYVLQEELERELRSARWRSWFGFQQRPPTMSTSSAAQSSEFSTAEALKRFRKRIGKYFEKD